MIREAETWGDIQAIVELGQAMHVEGLYRNVPYDEEWTGAWLGRHAKSDDAAVWIIESGDRMIGFFVGHIETFVFSPERIAVQDLLYIYPDQRGSKIAYRVLDAFAQWAWEQGAGGIQFSQTQTGDDPRWESFLGRFGYNKVGNIFMRTFH